MPAKGLKIVSQNLATPLVNIINASINQSHFPQDLKLTDVSPSYKNENINKANYRPVSIVAPVSTIYERLVADQLTDHFENIFDTLLSAFRKKHGCQTHLLKIVENWIYAFDKKHTVGAILMDLSKAFDCLPHKLLLKN